MIDNIDALRGLEHKQRILGSIIQVHCKHGKKCKIALWSMDSGFESLSDGIDDLVRNGMITIELYSKNEFSNIHVRSKRPFHNMEKYFDEIMGG